MKAVPCQCVKAVMRQRCHASMRQRCPASMRQFVKAVNASKLSCVKAVNAPKLSMRQGCPASIRQCVNWYLPFSDQCNNPIWGQHTINPSTFFSVSTFFSWYHFFNIKCTDCETTRKKIHFVCCTVCKSC